MTRLRPAQPSRTRCHAAVCSSWAATAFSQCQHGSAGNCALMCTQVGAWVPATSFRLSPADAIFVRMVSRSVNAAAAPPKLHFLHRLYLGHGAPLLVPLADAPPQLSELSELFGFLSVGGARPHPVRRVHLLCGAIRDGVHAAGALRHCIDALSSGAPSQQSRFLTYHHRSLQVLLFDQVLRLSCCYNAAGSNAAQHSRAGRAWAWHGHH